MLALAVGHENVAQRRVLQADKERGGHERDWDCAHSPGLPSPVCEQFGRDAPAVRHLESERLLERSERHLPGDESPRPKSGANGHGYARQRRLATPLQVGRHTDRLE